MMRRALFLGLVLTACSEPTRLVVVVDSNQALDEVVVRARAAGTTNWEPEQRIDLSQLDLPQSFVVEPLDGDTEGLVALEIQGFVAGNEVAARGAQSPFLSGRCARLELRVDGMCEGCARCESFCPTVAKTELIPIRCGDEIWGRDPGPMPTDAGVPPPTPDAGTTTTPDAGPPPKPATLVVTPTAIDFNRASSNPQNPNVRVGQQVQAELRLNNPGELALTGLRFALEPPFYLLGQPLSSIDAKGVTSVFISYRPTTEGLHDGQLELVADGASASVPLLGLASACPAGEVAEPDGRCRMECPEGTRDLDPNDNMPCECQIISQIDPPDPMELDSNCDGIDGDAANSVFVSPNGNDAAGGTRTAPVATIERALALARSSAPVKTVLVSEGTYTSGITLDVKSSVHGGYSESDNWSRDGLLARIEGAATAMRIHNTFGLELSRLDVSSADAVDPGASSIAIHVADTQQLILRSVVVESGAAMPGVEGAPGTAGSRGDNGGNGAIGNGSGQAGQGGSGGSSACGSSASSGGSGGTGGTADQVGAAGGATSVVGGLGGEPADYCALDNQCNGGSFTALAGQSGNDGPNGQAGDPGVAASSPAIARIGVVTAPGGSGLVGSPGDGGSGGGGGGGASVRVVGVFCDGLGCWCDYISQTCNSAYTGPASGGGGGGSGGCGGQGGTAGTAGGSSIAVAVVQSDVQILQSMLQAGDAAAGGRGGRGGAGGRGGSAGSGARDPQNNAGAGGDGGRGGDGGAGGGGSGGAGGWSVAVVRDAMSQVFVEGTERFVGQPGSGGAGGMGGRSGPSGPDGQATLEATWP